jgi:hypothetical protein
MFNTKSCHVLVSSDGKDWGKEDAYIAPPEHLVGKVLAKIQRDKAN